jgi:hypothetical protein
MNSFDVTKHEVLVAAIEFLHLVLIDPKVVMDHVGESSHLLVSDDTVHRFDNLFLSPPLADFVCFHRSVLVNAGVRVRPVHVAKAHSFFRLAERYHARADYGAIRRVRSRSRLTAVRRVIAL